LNFEVFYPTLTQSMIDNKEIPLPRTTDFPQFVTLDTNSGSPQVYGVDFRVIGNKLTWAGLRLEGQIILPSPPDDPFGTIIRIGIPYNYEVPPVPPIIPGQFLPPTITQFKTQFARDFPYGPTNDSVMDGDIQVAISEAGLIVNSSLFQNQAAYQLAYGYAAAHCLVTNLKNSSQGIAGGFSWLENSKSVGSVSQSFSIPDDVMKNPAMAMIAKTSYGAKYLSLILPYMYGNMAIVRGGTLS